MQVVTLLGRPETALHALRMPFLQDDGGAFMQGHMVAKLLSFKRLYERWPQFMLVLLGESGEPIARGLSVPFASHLPGREHYPSHGWGQVAVWAAEDALDNALTDTVCALEIMIHPDHRGKGLSGLVLHAMRDNAKRLGYAHLIAPVRPSTKSNMPNMPMQEFVDQVRSDGLPVDPWLRVHVRAGGKIMGIAECSQIVQAPLQQWRSWTGLPFDESGETVVQGGLAPVLVSVRQDVATYTEPNVWVLHSL
ncbi:N-acetyltransferase [Streptomyces sp. NPDC053431]|uniref:N-acetyltransferase n=1 Tax=Streptomyces sp. NPDC053431 TaxID=3365703 RepID=UPI0037D97B25